ncbi:hypothetical protein ACWIUH_01400 [Ursidibacter arcticus]
MQKKSLFEPLYPLLQAEEYTQLETETKLIFAEVFEQMLGQSMRDLLHYGSPHLGRLDLLKKFITFEGLGALRSDVENLRLGYLLKAWRTKNPKRGFHFLNTFLQMFYPNAYEIHQLWQKVGETYPTVLKTTQEIALDTANRYWLTSRVVVNITDPKKTAEEIENLQSELNRIAGARFLITTKLFNQIPELNIGIACGVSVINIVEIDANLVR